MKKPLSETKRLGLTEECLRYRFSSLENVLVFSKKYPEEFEHPHNYSMQVVIFAAKKEAKRLLSLSDAELIAENHSLIKKSHENEAVIATELQKIEEAEAVTNTSAALGKKFQEGRKPGTVGPIRKAITNLLKNHPELKNPDLWRKLAEKPPKNWEFVDRTEKYIEGPKNRKMKFGRFCTICGEERKKLKR